MKAYASLLLALLLAAPAAQPQRVVILSTNDTHSQIDPDPDSGLGGVARRKALIDSVRAVEPNVVLVDAGDAVQGSVFFTMFKGEVEQRLMDSLRYDIQIVGNHEFDNGMESLARQYATTPATLLSTNYDFSATPLAGRFAPYAIRRFGDKSIGFVAANLNPSGMIDDDNWRGLRWLDTEEALNAAAWWLKNVEKVDKVVALTHIGYTDDSGTDDSELARSSKYIDAIIGGHSHTLVDPSVPSSAAVNRDGEPLPISQARNKGRYVGELVIDFDDPSGGVPYGCLLPVDSRYDRMVDGSVEAIVAPYRHAVDSLSSQVIGRAPQPWAQSSPELLNWLSDYVKARGEELTGAPVDLALMNKGGIRTGLPKGKVTKGDIMAMLPFNNSIEVIELTGRDLLETFAINARQEGQGVSRGVEVVWDPATGMVTEATIDGRPVDPDATYRLATITYLSKGGDYMTPLRNGRSLGRSDGVIFDDIIRSMERGSLKLDRPDRTERMHAAD